MQRRMKQKRSRREQRTIFWAYFFRYCFPLLVAAISLCVFRNAVALGVGCLLISAYQFFGACTKNEVFLCAAQSSSHTAMTPGRHALSEIEEAKRDGICGGIIFGVIGLTMVVLSLFTDWLFF